MTMSLRLSRHIAAKEGPGSAAAALVARLEAGTAPSGRGTGAAEGLARALARQDNPASAEFIAKLGVEPKPMTPVAAAPTAPKAAAPKPAATATVLSQSDVNIAAAQARATERARATTVFASEHAKGREGVCAKLLAHESGFTAAAIIKQLPHLSTDRDLAVRAAASSNVAADAVWDRVNAQTSARLGLPAREVRTAPTPVQAVADAVWDKAYGLARQESAKVEPAAAAKSTESAGDAVWARAYGSAVQ